MPEKTLKEFKREIKEAGYRVKTGKIDPFGDGGSRCLDILDQDKNFVCGSSASVYTKELHEKHPEAFRLINENKGKVVDEDGKKVLM